MNLPRAASAALHLIASLTLGSVAAAILFAFKIGPVVYTLTATHGVHTGDLLAAAPALAAAWLARQAWSHSRTPVSAHA